VKKFIFFLALLSAVTLSAEQRRFRGPAAVGGGDPGGGESPPEVIFAHDFNGLTTNTGLGSTTPQTGTNWTRVITTPATHSLTNVTSGYVKPSAGAIGQILAYVANPTTTATTDQNVTLVNRSLPGTATTAPAPSGILFGYNSGTGTRCSLLVYNGSASPDIYLVEKLNGSTVTVLASQDANPVSGDTFTIRRRGNNVTALRNGSELFGGAVAAANCDTANAAGIILGAERDAGDKTDDLQRWDAITIENAGTGGAVTIPPSIHISQPVVSPFLTSDTSAVFSGTVTQGTGAITDVRVTCVGVSPVSSVLATGTTSWTYTVSLAAGDTDCTATVTSASGNATTSVMRFTRTTGGGGDTTPPTCDWITPASSPITYTSPPPQFQLACTDDTVPTSASFTNTAIAGTTNCTVSAPNAPNATVTCTVPLQPGGSAQTITVTVRDAANNSVQMTRVVTYITDVTFATTSLPNATQNVAYNRTLQCNGGVAPFTFQLLSGSWPTGISMNSSGVISGTHTGTGTFSNIVVRCSDSQAINDFADQTLSLTVQAAGAEGPHDYYLALKASPYRLFANGLRNLAGETTVTSYRSKCTAGCHMWYRYLTGDSFRDPQDGLKLELPQFFASSDEQMRFGIGASGFNDESVFVVIDYWSAAEWAQTYEGIAHEIFNHKGTPIYFFRGSQSAQLGLWSGYQEARQSLQTQIPGGPYTEMLWNHATSAIPNWNLNAWRDDNPCPGCTPARLRMPRNVASGVQRSYTEGMLTNPPFQPLTDDQSSVGGAASGAGQEIGVIGDRWHRFFFWFRREPSEDIASCDTANCGGATNLGYPRVAYRYTMWFADTVRGPIKVVDEFPISFLARLDNRTYVNEIRIEHACGNQCSPPTSNSLLVERPTLVKYYRNLVVLRGIPDADIPALLVKPVP
jgi:hypothetical protein